MAGVLATVDRRFLAWTAAWTVASLVGFGVVSAIIPNPVFGRQVPPEPFAFAVWLTSAPLMGLVAATYVAPATSATESRPMIVTQHAAEVARRGTTFGGIAGIGAFLAIGCPVCNKIAVLLLGTSGAMTVFAPLQPVIGAIALLLLGGTLAWRLRLRSTASACGTDR